MGSFADNAANIKARERGSRRVAEFDGKPGADRAAAIIRAYLSLQSLPLRVQAAC